MSDDWLDAAEPTQVAPDSEKPADAGVPGLPGTAIALAAETAARRGQFITCWQGLQENQRIFLNTWRDCRFNLSKAVRVLAATRFSVTRTTVHRWVEDPSFAYVKELLRSASVEEILSRDYLAARQEDIVETLLTPKPILHQGFATGHYEVEASAASKANETLLKLGGHLKDKDIDVNVGLVGPSFIIQVVQKDGTVIDATPRGVPVALPEPEVIDAEWLDGV